jgi:iron uptake system component EfeO
MTAARRVPLAILAVTVSALAACAGSGGTAEPPAGAGSSAGGDARVAHVTITAANGCVSDRTEFAAGGLSFKITNQDATAVSEVELLAGERILAEKENLPPGLGGEFAVTVGAGTYTLYCPGAATERSTITVTGKAAPVDDTLAGLLKTATDDYKSYVDDQLSYLVDGAEKLAAALHGTSLAKAQDVYKTSRSYYEKVEPVAESFVSPTQNLDADIDARENDVAASRWSGFHLIEKALFRTKSLAGLGRWGDKLVADCKTLQAKAKTLTYTAPDLANGAQGLLDEVASGKITGEEERYSHIDLLDMANNVEGSEQAFADLRPALDKIDKALGDLIAGQFAALNKVLDGYRSTSDPSGFVLYTSLTDADVRSLASAVKAVQEPLSRVAAKVANA